MKTEIRVAWSEVSQGYDKNTVVILVPAEGKNASRYWEPFLLGQIWDSSIMFSFSSQLVWVQILQGTATDPGSFRRHATLHIDNLPTETSSLLSVNYLVTVVTTKWRPVTCWERDVFQLYLFSGQTSFPFNLRETVLLLIYTHYYMFA